MNIALHVKKILDLIEYIETHDPKEQPEEHK